MENSLALIIPLPTPDRISIMKNQLVPPVIRTLFACLFFLAISQQVHAQCAITGDSIVCENEAATYTTSATGAVYEWNAYPGVVSGSGNTVTVNWTGTGSGLVTLVVKDGYGIVTCATSYNIDIYEKPQPMITPSFVASCSNEREKGQERKDGGCLSVCDSTWVTYSVLPHSGSTYAWTIAGTATVIPSTTNTIQVFWTGTGPGVVKVTETNMYGCMGSTELCVEVVESPNASFITTPASVGGTTTVCLGQDVIFQNTSNSGGGSDLWSYTWVWGDGNQEVVADAGWDNFITYAYNSPGTYNVMMIAENECHCKDTAYINVQVLSDPPPNIECISTVCPGSTVSYNTDASCTGYTWSVSNGTIIGDSTNSSVTVNWGSSSPGWLSLATTGCTPATCPVANTVSVPIIAPTATIYGADIVCQYDCEKYHISCDIPVDSIVWHLPGGMTITTDTTNVHDIEVCYYDPSFDTGTIFVEYFHTTPGSVDGLSCGGTASLFVKQRPKINLNAPAEICDSSAFNLYFNNSAATLSVHITDGLAVDTTFSISAVTNYSGIWNWGPGTFTITVSDTAGYYCNSPESVNLIVHETPPPPAGIVGADTICPLSAYSYSGIATSSEYAVVWGVTGSTGSGSGVGPTYPLIWGASGPYEICIYQIDPLNNCKSAKICDTIVSASPLAPAVVSGPDTVCQNGQTSYNASSFATSFSWSVSPAIAGSVVAGQGSSSPTIEWNNWTGGATLTVVAYGCNNDSAITTYPVLVIGTPAPSLTVPPTVCEGVAAVMTSSTTGATLSWDFGDGSPAATGSTVTHIYNSPGSHIVTLTATYTGSCNGSASAVSSIMVYPEPNITISTPDPNIFCGTVMNVNMYVASPVAGTSYVWYKSPSTVVSSGTSYTTNVLGSYYVIGTNSYGCLGTSNTILIDTSCDPPCKPAQPAYVGYTRQRIGCNTDTFSGFGSPGAINFTYDFDDPFGSPSTASGINASHTFPEPGFYRVEICADVPNATGTGYCHICRMQVDTILYIADFADSVYCTNGSDSVSIKLINNTKILSTAPTPSYAWSINSSGTLSTMTDPTFTLAPGTYNITLTVNGNCTQTQTFVVDSVPNASFVANDSICQGAPLGLLNTSTGADSSVFWTFGDGASSAVFSPTKVYESPGNYTVTLSIVSSYGCTDTAQETVVVLPNTLNALYTFPSSTLCEGDSVILTNATSGGYPGYSWLWSTIETTADITVKYTGSYYFDVTDNKGCQARSNTEDFLFNPTPKPQIIGSDVICLGSPGKHTVNYPTSGYTFVWSVDGTVATGWTGNFYILSKPPGTYTLTVQVSSSVGCIGYDTMDITVVNLPNVSISSASPVLCEGESHLLVGSSTSNILTGSFWSTGATNDSIMVSVPGQYTYTVTDTFGCSNSASQVVHPLPEFCGLMTGCYTICDTIDELVWYAPKGYAGYQWLYNGSAIAGATTDTLHVPLYQSGSYQVVITSAVGCTDTSDFIDIEFTTCGECELKIQPEIECGPVDAAGNQTYNLTLQVFNSVDPGSYFGIYSPEGSFSSITPTTLALGWNTVTATFTDAPPANDTICLNISISNNIIRCDTNFCMPLPKCEGDCEMTLKFQKIRCAGYDSYGNPMYLVCADLNWGGSTTASATIVASGGSISPTPVSVSPGINSLCFTYTDLPPYGSTALFTFYVYDSSTNKICKGSFKADYKPCPDSCTFEVYGICAHCKDSTDAGQMYNIELTVDNTLGSGAVPSILPISGGYFGAITPNPVPAGLQTLEIPFTDVPGRDSIICFRILLELDGHTCWQDVCVYLPECDELSISSLNKLTYFSIAPNPANDGVRIFHNSSGNSENKVVIYNTAGQQVRELKLDNLRSGQFISTSDLPDGMYIVNFTSDGQDRGRLKLIIHH